MRSDAAEAGFACEAVYAAGAGTEVAGAEDMAELLRKVLGMHWGVPGAPGGGGLHVLGSEVYFDDAGLSEEGDEEFDAPGAGGFAHDFCEVFGGGDGLIVDGEDDFERLDLGDGGLAARGDFADDDAGGLRV